MVGLMADTSGAVRGEMGEGRRWGTVRGGENGEVEGGRMKE